MEAVEPTGCACGAVGCGPEQRVPAFFAVDGHGDQADDSADDAADENGGNHDCHEGDGHCDSCCGLGAPSTVMTRRGRTVTVRAGARSLPFSVRAAGLGGGPGHAAAGGLTVQLGDPRRDQFLGG
jgi:hypothetical protein